MNKSQLIKSLKSKGFSKNILNAFSKVKRENFVPTEIKNQAYEDRAQSIGMGQTISQPYTIATMLEILELKNTKKSRTIFSATKSKTPDFVGGQNVLEIGSGCGYVLALISEITKSKVYGIERIKELSEKSKQNLKNYENIRVYNKNGSDGLKEFAPYDRILISAALKKVPKNLLNQLSDNGILVAPVDSNYGQDLIAIQRLGNEYIEKQKIHDFIFVRFVEE